MQELGQKARSAARTDEMFVGRGHELEQLAGSAERARDRHSVAFCIDGEAGIGKTALLNQFLTGLSGFTVLRATCDPSESDMPFGLVGQLTTRVPKGRLDRYPAIMKLATAPGAPPTPSLTAVGVQLRLLVDELLDSGPVALAVDDLQWADWPSGQALRMALRERRSDPLLVLATVQTVSGTPTGGPGPRLLDTVGDFVRMSLPGLDVSSVAALTALRTAVPWSRRAVEELCLRTEGHPLYLQMVLADAEGPKGASRVPGSLVATMRARLDGLDPESRSLVDALAVLNAFVPPTLAAAVANLADPWRALQRPLQLGLVQWQGVGSTLIGMAHELQREAVYSALAPTRRRELHLAAVPVVEGPSKWAHRVAAAQQADTQSIAAELETAAWEQIAAGDTDRAATWLLWAADLSDKREDRERRLLTAVIQLLSGRRMDRAQPALEAVQACSPSPLKDCALGVAAGYQGAYPVARERLTAAMRAAARQPGLEWVVAEAGNLIAALSCWHGLGDVGLQYAQEVLATSGTVPHLAAPARTAMLIGHLLVEGPEAALAHVGAAVEPWTSQAGGPAVPANAYWHACLALAHVALVQPTAGERHARLALSEPSTTSAEAWSGDLAYFCLSMGQYQRGVWDESAGNAEHCLSIAEGLDHPWACARAHMVASLTASGRGAFESAREHVRASRYWVQRVGPQQFEVYPAMAGAVLAQAQGDLHAMAAALRPIRDHSGGWIRAYRYWWLPLLAEALLGTGRIGRATAAVQELRELTRHAPCLGPIEAWLSGQLLEYRGDIDAATAAYEAGLALPKSPQDIPLHRARLEQALGHLQAARGAEQLAITHLRNAHSRYQALGAAPFQSRCHDELIALIRSSEHPDV